MTDSSCWQKERGMSALGWECMVRYLRYLRYGHLCSRPETSALTCGLFLGSSTSASNLVCGCSGPTLVGWLVWYGKHLYRGATADHRPGNDRTIVTERIVRCKHAKPGDKSRCRLDHQTVNCLPYSTVALVVSSKISYRSFSIWATHVAPHAPPRSSAGCPGPDAQSASPCPWHA